jgi:signal recognition particle GTPase
METWDMTNTTGLKLFISYSHSDEEHIKRFTKHIAPLKNKGLVEEWYDRKITSGKEFQGDIDTNLQDADVICLFISANFLSSSACLKEKAQALELKRMRGVTVVPVILSPCGWLDDENISSLLALPIDGKPITSFSDPDGVWNNVYEGLKKVFEDAIVIRQLKLADNFVEFLQNTELLSKAHSQKGTLHLDDIFIWPELAKYDDMRDHEKTIKSESIIEEYTDRLKIVIVGESQSGKTTLCKKLFVELRKRNFVPVYVADRTGRFAGKIENRVLKAFNDQYSGVAFEKIDKTRIVPIVDDFHYAAKRQEHINALATYRNQIILVDDIFCLNFEDEQLTNSFGHFRIVQLKPSYRYQLVRKWASLTDRAYGSSQADDNGMYQAIDTTTEFVNAALGKIIGSGIMPAYPFFILSVISTVETLEKPLDQEITSQGYCYQALIYMYLRKQGVRNDEVDTYMNFLSEFSFYFFREQKHELAVDDFRNFMKTYVQAYNLPISESVLLDKLRATQIIAVDSLNNYSFNYPYLYYFFVAKYLSEHSEANLGRIASIVANLHTDENAYIAVFISHHAKNTAFLEEIILNSMCLFDKYEPATLNREELSFFDDQVNGIIEAVLPPADSTPEKERAHRLADEDMSERAEVKNSTQPKKQTPEEYDELARELRRSIKTVEVMGQIIKNRAGSLKKEKIEYSFEQAMKTLLRILSSFFALIRREDAQKDIVSYISARIENHIREKSKGPSQEKLRTPSRKQLEILSESIFWTTNFTVIYGFINKIVHALGSDKLVAVVEKVCDAENTPAAFLVKHGILMWYDKNLRVDPIAAEINKEQFSETAKRVMKFMIANHCAMHAVNYKDKQKIEHRIGIPVKKLLANKLRKDNV